MSVAVDLDASMDVAKSLAVSAAMCCVEACLIDCYLSDSGLYVHESCCLGVQRRLPTYESCSRFQEGHETSVKQVWCLISVTISPTFLSYAELARRKTRDRIVCPRRVVEP